MNWKLLHEAEGQRTFAVIFDTGDEVAVVGKADGTAHGGHLIEAHVRPTLEVVLIESPSYLQREIDKATGIALTSGEPAGADWGVRSGTQRIRSAKDRSARSCQSETSECSHSRSGPLRLE